MNDPWMIAIVFLLLLDLLLFSSCCCCCWECTNTWQIAGQTDAVVVIWQNSWNWIALGNRQRGKSSSVPGAFPNERKVSKKIRRNHERDSNRYEDWQMLIVAKNNQLWTFAIVISQNCTTPDNCWLLQHARVAGVFMTRRQHFKGFKSWQTR